MATSLQSYTKSTLPSLLDRYQPLHCRNQSSRKQKKKSSDNKSREGFHEPSFLEDGEDEAKKALLEQRHLETYKNMHRLRNSMYVQYMDLLNTKVEKQRGRMHMCHLHFKDPLEHGEKKTITEQQLPYVRLSHDVKYLQSVPKSSNYLIVGLQNELSRSGVLKSRADHEVFHHLIQTGAASSQLKEKLLDVKSKMTACKSLPSFHLVRDSTQQTADDPSIKKGQKQLSNDSFPGLLPSQPRAHHLSKHREAQEEHEKRLPKLPLSRLPELQLLPEQTYKAQGMDRFRLNERHPRQEMYLHQLRQMYYRSLSNMASSRRLLEKNGLFADFEEEHSVHNLFKRANRK